MDTVDFDGDASFRYDSNKSWFMFGRGRVDKTGTDGGPVWIPDSAVSQCSTCRLKFDFFNRKHHCRYCGKIFCGGCSESFMLLPVYFGVREPQRVCRSCSVTLEPMQTSLASSISNSTRDTEFDPDDVGKYMLNPLSFSMSAEIKKACHSIENFFGHSPNSTIQDQYIPAVLLKQAKGLAFLTVIKAGMVFTGRIGTGIVVAKDAEGNWTAPSAIGIGGLGWGFQIGGEVSDFVIILNTDSAVDAFSGKAQVSLGSQLGISVGPVGRTGEATMNIGDGGLAPCYSYSQSKGLFAGISLEGAVISERTSINHNFYGLKCEGKDLLAGKYPPPKAAAPLYNALRTALNKDPGSLLGSNNNNQI